jgi:hypothetical protein
MVGGGERERKKRMRKRKRKRAKQENVSVGEKKRIQWKEIRDCERERREIEKYYGRRQKEK